MLEIFIVILTTAIFYVPIFMIIYKMRISKIKSKHIENLNIIKGHSKLLRNENDRLFDIIEKIEAEITMSKLVIVAIEKESEEIKKQNVKLKDVLKKMKHLVNYKNEQMESLENDSKSHREKLDSILNGTFKEGILKLAEDEVKHLNKVKVMYMHALQDFEKIYVLKSNIENLSKSIYGVNKTVNRAKEASSKLDDFFTIRERIQNIKVGMKNKKDGEIVIPEDRTSFYGKQYSKYPKDERRAIDRMFLHIFHTGRISKLEKTYEQMPGWVKEAVTLMDSVTKIALSYKEK